MRNLEKKLRAAIVQAAPVFFDKQATLQKVACLSKKPVGMGHNSSFFPNRWSHVILMA